MPCAKHDHQPWPRHGGHELRIEACETICGWCRTPAYTTKSANNLRVHARRHLKNPDENLHVVIVQGKAGRSKVNGIPAATHTQYQQNQSFPKDAEFSPSLNVVEQSDVDVCTECRVQKIMLISRAEQIAKLKVDLESCEKFKAKFKADVDSREELIVSLKAQLQDLGAAVMLFGSGAKNKPSSSPQMGDAENHEPQLDTAKQVIQYGFENKINFHPPPIFRAKREHTPRESELEANWLILQGSLRPATDYDKQIVRSALSVLGHRLTGKFEDVCYVAWRILNDEPYICVEKDEEHNIRNALWIMGYRLTGKFEDPFDLARRVIEHGDWDLNMSALPSIRSERGSVICGASHDHFTTDDSGYGVSQPQQDCANCHTRVSPEWRLGPSGQRDLCDSCGLRWAKQTSRSTSATNDSRLLGSPHTAAPTITNTDTRDSLLASDNLPINPDARDQPVPGIIRAVPEPSNSNEAFWRANPAGLSQDPLYNWFTDNTPPWVPKTLPNPRSSDLVCPTCNKAVETTSELKKHELRHMKPFKCEVIGCARTTDGFSTPNDLDRHTRSKHPSPVSNELPLKKFRCLVPGCKSKDKTWQRLDNFRSHLKRVHPHVLSTESDFEDMIQRGEYWEQPKVDEPGEEFLS